MFWQQLVPTVDSVYLLRLPLAILFCHHVDLVLGMHKILSASTASKYPGNISNLQPIPSFNRPSAAQILFQVYDGVTKPARGSKTIGDPFTLSNYHFGYL